MTSKVDFLPFLSPDSPAFANWNKVLFANAKLQAHALKAVLRYQVEGLTFLKHRYEQDLKFIDDLVASDEFNDAFKVMSGFMQNAVSEYSAETGKIATMGSKLASDTAKRVRKAAEEVIDEKPAYSAA